MRISLVLMLSCLAGCGGSGSGGGAPTDAGAGTGSTTGGGGTSGGTGGTGGTGTGGTAVGGTGAYGGSGGIPSGGGGATAGGGAAGQGGTSGCGNLALCSGVCTDTQTSVDHCGACDTPCPNVNTFTDHATVSCDAGKCALKCSSGFADCNGVVDDGCEASLSDSNHCGTCGRVCDSGCNNATCQWTKVASSLDSPVELAVDANNVYFGDYGGLQKVPKSGGTIVQLAVDSGDFGDIVVDATRVYWTDQDPAFVRSVPIAGGSTQTHATGTKFQLNGLYVSPTTLYWATGFGGSIESISLSGGAPVNLASGESYTSRVSLVGTTLVWTQTISSGAVWKLDLATSGATPQVLASGSQPSALATANGSVFYSANGNIMKVDLAGGAPVPLAAANNVLEIVTDGLNVYWLSDPQTQLTGKIVRVPVDGGPTFTIAHTLYNPSRIAMDETHVYWTDVLQNDIKRVSK